MVHLGARESTSWGRQRYTPGRTKVHPGAGKVHPGGGGDGVSERVLVHVGNAAVHVLDRCFSTALSAYQTKPLLAIIIHKSDAGCLQILAAEPRSHGPREPQRSAVVPGLLHQHWRSPMHPKKKIGPFFSPRPGSQKFGSPISKMDHFFSSVFTI